MSDVNININGRNNISSVFREVRKDAQAVGQDMSKLDDMANKTRTQQRQVIEEFTKETYSAKKQGVVSKYEQSRSSVLSEAEKERERISSKTNIGDSRKKDLLAQVSRKAENEVEALKSEEEKELLNVNKEELNVLREIKKQLTDAEKIEREKRQDELDVDKNKMKSGYYGGLLSNREKLKKDQLSAGSEEEAKNLQKQIEDNEAKIRGIKGGEETVEGGAGSAIMGMAGRFLAPAAIIATVLKLVKMGSEQEENIYKLNAYRGSTQEGEDQIRSESTSTVFGLGAGKNWNKLGMDNDDALKSQLNLMKTSGIGGQGLTNRAYENSTIERGLGVENVAQYSVLERQMKNGETTAKGIIDMTNILSNIEGSGVTKDDVTLLGEKLGMQQKLNQIQFSHRDTIDSNITNKMMGAFSMVGLNEKGSKGGDFLGNIISGTSSKNNTDNLSVLKYQVARKAFPNLSERDLARKLEEGTDPVLQNALMQTIGEMTPDSEGIGRENMNKAIFQGMDISGRETINKAIGNKKFSNAMTKGVGINTNGAYTQEGIEKAANFNTGGWSEGVATISTAVSQLGSDLIKDATAKWDALTELLTNGNVKTETLQRATGINFNNKVAGATVGKK